VLDIFTINFVLGMVDLSNDQVRYVGTVLSKLFPSREGLRAVRIGRVVEHNKHIFVDVLHNFMPGLTHNLNNGSVGVLFGDGGTLVVRGKLIVQEVFSKFLNLLFTGRPSGNGQSVLGGSKFSGGHYHYHGEFRLFETRKFLQVLLYSLFFSTRRDEVDFAFQGISSLGEGSLVASAG